MKTLFAFATDNCDTITYKSNKPEHNESISDRSMLSRHDSKIISIKMVRGLSGQDGERFELEMPA